MLVWVAVEELNLNYHNSDTIFISYYGSLNLNSNPVVGPLSSALA